LGIYSDVILHKLVHKVCSDPAFSELRGPFIGQLKGVGLELGVGYGLNFSHYELSHIEKLYILEPCPKSIVQATEHAKTLSLPVEVIEYQDQTRLPLADNSLDFVVTTWTLCTIKQVEQTLTEVARVLKPDGRYYFLEHGLSPDRGVAFCQHLFNPLQKTIGGGCHLNREMESIITRSGFSIEHLDKFYMDAIKMGGYIYKGIAKTKC